MTQPWKCVATASGYEPGVWKLHIGPPYVNGEVQRRDLRLERPSEARKKCEHQTGSYWFSWDGKKLAGRCKKRLQKKHPIMWDWLKKTWPLVIEAERRSPA